MAPKARVRSPRVSNRVYNSLSNAWSTGDASEDLSNLGNNVQSPRHQGSKSGSNAPESSENNAKSSILANEVTVESLVRKFAGRPALSTHSNQHRQRQTPESQRVAIDQGPVRRMDLNTSEMAEVAGKAGEDRTYDMVYDQVNRKWVRMNRRTEPDRNTGEGGTGTTIGMGAGNTRIGDSGNTAVPGTDASGTGSDAGSATVGSGFSSGFSSNNVIAGSDEVSSVVHSETESDGSLSPLPEPARTGKRGRKAKKSVVPESPKRGPGRPPKFSSKPKARSKAREENKEPKTETILKTEESAGQELSIHMRTRGRAAKKTENVTPKSPKHAKPSKASELPRPHVVSEKDDALSVAGRTRRKVIVPELLYNQPILQQKRRRLRMERDLAEQAAREATEKMEKHSAEESDNRDESSKDLQETISKDADSTIQGDVNESTIDSPSESMQKESPKILKRVGRRPKLGKVHKPKPRAPLLGPKRRRRKIYLDDISSVSSISNTENVNKSTSNPEIVRYGANQPLLLTEAAKSPLTLHFPVIERVPTGQVPGSQARLQGPDTQVMSSQLTPYQIPVRVPGQPAISSQVPGQPAISSQVPGQPAIYSQVPGQPAISSQVPGQPAIYSQVPAQPAISSQVPGQPAISSHQVVSTQKTPPNQKTPSSQLMPTSMKETQEVPSHPKQAVVAPAIESSASSWLPPNQAFVTPILESSKPGSGSLPQLAYSTPVLGNSKRSSSFAAGLTISTPIVDGSQADALGSYPPNPSRIPITRLLADPVPFSTFYFGDKSVRYSVPTGQPLQYTPNGLNPAKIPNAKTVPVKPPRKKGPAKSKKDKTAERDQTLPSTQIPMPSVNVPAYNQPPNMVSPHMVPRTRLPSELSASGASTTLTTPPLPAAITSDMETTQRIAKVALPKSSMPQPTSVYAANTTIPTYDTPTPANPASEINGVLTANAMSNAVYASNPHVYGSYAIGKNVRSIELSNYAAHSTGPQGPTRGKLSVEQQSIGGVSTKTPKISTNRVDASGNVSSDVLPEHNVTQQESARVANKATTAYVKPNEKTTGKTIEKTKSLKKRKFKKFERSKKKLVINPSSESEESLSSLLEEIAAEQVEVVPNGSVDYDNFKNLMINELIRDKELLKARKPIDVDNRELGTSSSYTSEQISEQVTEKVLAEVFQKPQESERQGGTNAVRQSIEAYSQRTQIPMEATHARDSREGQVLKSGQLSKSQSLPQVQQPVQQPHTQQHTPVYTQPYTHQQQPYRQQPQVHKVRAARPHVYPTQQSVPTIPVAVPVPKVKPTRISKANILSTKRQKTAQSDDVIVISSDENLDRTQGSHNASGYTPQGYPRPVYVANMGTQQSHVYSQPRRNYAGRHAQAQAQSQDQAQPQAQPQPQSQPQPQPQTQVQTQAQQPSLVLQRESHVSLPLTSQPFSPRTSQEYPQQAVYTQVYSRSPQVRSQRLSQVFHQPQLYQTPVYSVYQPAYPQPDYSRYIQAYQVHSGLQQPPSVIRGQPEYPYEESLVLIRVPISSIQNPNFVELSSYEVPYPNPERHEPAMVATLIQTSRTPQTYPPQDANAFVAMADSSHISDRSYYEVSRSEPIVKHSRISQGTQTPERLSTNHREQGYPINQRRSTQSRPMPVPMATSQYQEQYPRAEREHIGYEGSESEER